MFMYRLNPAVFSCTSSTFRVKGRVHLKMIYSHRSRWKVQLRKTFSRTSQQKQRFHILANNWRRWGLDVKCGKTTKAQGPQIDFLRLLRSWANTSTSHMVIVNAFRLASYSEDFCFNKRAHNVFSNQFGETWITLELFHVFFRQFFSHILTPVVVKCKSFTQLSTFLSRKWLYFNFKVNFSFEGRL